MKALPKVYLPKPQNTPPAEGRLIDANQNTLNDNFLRLITEVNALEAGGGVDPASIAQMRQDIAQLGSDVIVLQSDLADAQNALCNPNLLDNWYFAGGGSQQGGGQFPINQRGNTTYSPGYGYTIDRWKKSTTTVTLYSSYVEFKNTSASTDWIVQPFPFNEPWPFYKFVTGTILFQDGTLLSGTIYPNSDVQTASSQYWEFANASWGNFFLEISATGTNDYRFVIRLNAGQTINVVAVKMEIGTHQTLAYYDLAANKWKPRELPEYTEQLSRCQRYFYRINRPVATTNMIAFAHAFSTSALVVAMPVPHMREITSVTTSHTFRITNNNGTTVNASSYSPRNSDGGVECTIDIGTASTSLTTGNIYILVTNGAGYMDFNADL